MSRNKKKERRPRKDFAERFADKLRQSELGVVDEGALGDGSGRWVTLKVGPLDLSFSFDMKGGLITDVGLYKDVIEVTGQHKIFNWDKNKSK